MNTKRINYILYLFFATFGVLFSATVYAASRVDTLSARLVAYNFIKNKVSDRLKDANQLELYASSSSNIYAFNVPDGGFVLLSAYDGVSPVLGYSTTGSYDEQTMPDNAKKWLSGYENTLEKAQEMQVNAEDAGNKWIQLKSGNARGLKAGEVVVAPLVTATWYQNKEYSYYCPSNSELGTAVLGCVPVAMAEIMHYWRYPSKGLKSVSYTDENYGDLSLDLTTLNFDYDQMPTKLDSTSTDAEIQSVAMLGYACAIGIKAQFGPPGAGTGGYLVTNSTNPKASAEYALVNYFGFNRNIRKTARLEAADYNWNTIMKNELDNGRPMLMGGTDAEATGGHAFVVDGYDSDNYYHFNWGWNGKLNGFFRTDSLIPYNEYDFSHNQILLYGIRPPQGYTTSDELVEAADDYQLSFFPEMLVVTTADTDVPFSGVLYNVTGVKYRTAVSKEGKMEVNVSGLPVGVYLLNLEKQGIVVRRKVVVGK